MRSRVLSVLAASAALAPFMAQAEGLSYTYAEAAWLQSDINEFDEDLGGFGLRASWEIVDHVFVFGRYADQKTDARGGGEFKFQPWDLGVGYAYPVNESFDVYGTLSYSNIDADAPGQARNTSDDGYTLGVGGRTRLAEQLELEGAVKYANFSDYGDNTAFEFAARWFFTDAFAVGVEVTAGDEVDTLGAGVRYQFPAR